MSVFDPDSEHFAGVPRYVESDRACVGCGYNLVGLKTTDVCPECGRPVGVKNRFVSRHDNLVRAPLAWIDFFTWGATLLLLTAPLFVITMMVSALDDGPVPPVVLMMFGLTWVAGVFIVTRPRPVTDATSIQPEREWRAMRWAARLSQCFWLAWCAFDLFEGLVSTSGATMHPMLQYAWIGTFLIAGLGLVPLCIMVSHIAFWAQDDALGNMLRSLCWVIGVCVVLLSLDMTFSSLGRFLNFFLFLGNNILFLVWMGMGFAALWRTRSMARWAVINHVIADEHDYRMAEQAQGLIERQKKEEARRRREAVARSGPARERVRDGKPVTPPRAGEQDDAPIPLVPERSNAPDAPKISHLSSTAPPSQNDHKQP
jgi:hypothetical protein